MEYPNFVGPTYTLPARVAGVEQCMNFFTEVLVSAGNRPKKQYSLNSTPGLTLFSGGYSGSPNRAAFELDGRAFTVAGPFFYEVFADGTRTERGQVDMAYYPATICGSGDGGNQIMVTSGGKVYIYNLVTNAFAVVPGVVGHFGGFLAGRFLALDTDTSTLRISDLYAGLTWNALQFRQRSLAADRWKSMVVTQSLIYLIGSQSFEIWWNSGASPFPFEPIQGALFSTGIKAGYSANRTGETVMWLSSNDEGSGTVVASRGGQADRVSNHAIETMISQAERDGYEIDDAVAMTYSENGHPFYVLTFVEPNFTVAYDQSTSQWHERGFWNNSAVAPARFDAWRPLFHMYAFGKHLVGDRTTGNIYQMSTDLYFDVENQYIRRVRRAPHLYNERDLVYYSRLELDMRVGVGNSDDPDPQIMMRYSNDAGSTWGMELAASIGAVGEYNTCVYWNRLGRAYDRVFEVAVSAPVPVTIVGAYLSARSR